MSSFLPKKSLLGVGIVTAMILLCSAIYIKALDDDEFLSFIRYKHFGANEIQNTQYYTSIFQNSDSLYLFSVNFCQSYERLIVHWNGDSVFQNAIGCGYLNLEHSGVELWGYDSSVVSIKRNQLIPMKVGTTEAYIRYPNGIDTLSIRISEQNCKLTLEERIIW